MFVGPESQGKGGQVVDNGYSVAVFGQIDGADVVAASFAGFHADVGELLSHVHRELVFGCFTAGGTEDAAKFPFVQAEGTQEKPLAAVPFNSQYPEHGRRSAKRAYRVRGDGRRCSTICG